MQLYFVILVLEHNRHAQVVSAEEYFKEAHVRLHVILDTQIYQVLVQLVLLLVQLVLQQQQDASHALEVLVTIICLTMTV